MVGLLLHEVVQALHIERPAVEGPKVKELDDERSAVRPPETSADVESSMEDYRSLLYGVRAAQLGSVHSSSVKKRKRSSSMTATGRQSKKVARASLYEAAKVAAENVTKVEDVIDVTLAGSRALKPEAESAFQVLKAATREYCFIRDTFCNVLKDLYELQKGPALHQNMNAVLVGPP